MRILITGSRTWDHRPTIRRVLEDAMGSRLGAAPITVVHGGAAGADTLAGIYARSLANIGYQVAVEVHPADWKTHGKRAGMLRNQHMVDLGADVCLAFIRDNSPGATACARMAETAGIRVVRTHYPS